MNIETFKQNVGELNDDEKSLLRGVVVSPLPNVYVKFFRPEHYGAWQNLVQMGLVELWIGDDNWYIANDGDPNISPYRAVLFPTAPRAAEPGVVAAEAAAELTKAQWEALKYLVSCGDHGAYKSNRTGSGNWTRFIHQKSANVLIEAGYGKTIDVMQSHVYVTDLGRTECAKHFGAK